MKKVVCFGDSITAIAFLKFYLIESCCQFESNLLAP